MTQLQENEIVMCKVKRIEKTIVFLEIDGHGDGTMIISEVSPGRIRNIRDYITINKKIVCKVLRIRDGHPEMSLRRVTAKERNEILETQKKEKMLMNMIKPVLKDQTSDALKKIKSSYELEDFLDEARENPKLLKTIASGSNLEQLKKIFSEKRETEKEVKKTIKIKSNSSSGLEDIKTILDTKDATITYKGSSNFFISMRANDFKTANQKLELVLEKIKERAKKLNVQLEIK